MNNPPLSIESVTQGIKKARARWIDARMKEHLPARIYNQVHALDSFEQAKGLKWVQERGYRIYDEGENIILKKGDKILAQVRLMLELDDKGLRELAKVSKIRQNGEK